MRPEMSRYYNDFAKCFAGCGTFDGKDNLLNNLEITQLICVNDTADIEAARPCYEKSADAIKKGCTENCTHDLAKKEADMQALPAKSDTKAAIAASDDMCSMVQCQLNCIPAIMDDVCKDDKPAKLLKQLIQIDVDTTGNNAIIQAGNTPPPNCKKLGGSA